MKAQKEDMNNYLRSVFCNYLKFRFVKSKVEKVKLKKEWKDAKLAYWPQIPWQLCDLQTNWLHSSFFQFLWSQTLMKIVVEIIIYFKAEKG